MMIVKDLKSNKDKGVTKYLFCCDWCGEEFSLVVRRSNNDGCPVSDQVRCPRCKGFISTWS